MGVLKEIYLQHLSISLIGTGNTWTVHVVPELVSGFFVRSHFNTMLKEFFESRGWCAAGARFVL